jgi:hypothetical protein
MMPLRVRRRVPTPVRQARQSQTAVRTSPSPYVHPSPFPYVHPSPSPYVHPSPSPYVHLSPSPYVHPSPSPGEGGCEPTQVRQALTQPETCRPQSCTSIPLRLPPAIPSVSLSCHTLRLPPETCRPQSCTSIPLRLPPSIPSLHTLRLPPETCRPLSCTSIPLRLPPSIPPPSPSRNLQAAKLHIQSP